MIDRGSARIFTIGSFSGDATKEYTVVVAEDPALSTCTCPAFFYRKRERHELCKHIREAEMFGPTEATVLGTGFSIKDIGDLFVRALTWVDNDADRAAGLVEAYLKGAQGRPL